MRIPGISIAVFIVSIVALPASTFAQIATPAVEPRASEDPNSWASLSYAHLFETDIDDTPVEVERESLLVIAGHRFELSDSVGLVTQAVYQLSAYDFSGDGGALWEDIHQLTVLTMIDWKLDERWSLLGGGLFRFSAESDADFGDALTGGDLNDDCEVGPIDLAMLLGSWGPCADCDNCPADLDGDCNVGPADLAILLGNWG